MRKVPVTVTTVVSAVLAWTAQVSAAPMQLNCTLTDTAVQLGSENHPVVLTFDEQAKTLSAQDGSQKYNFGDVSISNIAISGDVGNVSVGIDRSSLGIVWQQYGAGAPAAQFGQCRQSTSATTANTP